MLWENDKINGGNSGGSKSNSKDKSDNGNGQDKNKSNNGHGTDKAILMIIFVILYVYGIEVFSGDFSVKFETTLFKVLNDVLEVKKIAYSIESAIEGLLSLILLSAAYQIFKAD